MNSDDIAIKVKNICKRYRIGLKEEMHDSIGSAIFDFIKSPIRNYRKYRSLYKFDDINPGSESHSRSNSIIWALRNVNFKVKRGDVLGIIGRNGAGKSTLLKILSRITDPTSGIAEIHGRVASLLEVGTGFHQELTGRENVYLNGTILGMKKKEVDLKFDEIVEFSGVEKFLDTPVKRYSSGMKIRLAFSVAAHLEPDILLIDEVLAVGDLPFQKKCLGKMENIANSGKTVIFVSHNIGAIKSLCTKAILLNDGELIYDGLTEDTINQYLSTIPNSDHEDSLNSRTDRVGGDNFRFTELNIYNSKSGIRNKNVISGQKIFIKVKYSCQSTNKLKDVIVSIGFFTNFGTFLFSTRSEAVGKNFDIDSASGHLSCIIPKLPLKAGRYFLNLIAENRGTTLDWIKNAGYIDVENGDFHGTGKLSGTAHNDGFLIDFDWEKS
jgi:lipopolysaccharide transport system ATP-binding protein